MLLIGTSYTLVAASRTCHAIINRRYLSDFQQTTFRGALYAVHSWTIANWEYEV